VLALLLHVCVLEPVPELERGELAVGRGGRGDRRSGSGSGGRAVQEGYVGSVQWSRQPLELLLLVMVAGDMRLRIGLKGPPSVDTHNTRGHGEVEVVFSGGSRRRGRRRCRVDGHEMVLQEREVRHLGVRLAAAAAAPGGDGDGTTGQAEVLCRGHGDGRNVAEVRSGGGEGVRHGVAPALPGLREPDVVSGGGDSRRLPGHRRLLLGVLVLSGGGAGRGHPRKQLGEGRRLRRGGGGGVVGGGVLVLVPGNGVPLPCALPRLDPALGAGEGEDGALAGLGRAAASGPREMLLLVVVVVVVTDRRGVVLGGGRVRGEARGGVERGELVDGLGSGPDEPLDGLAGLVVAEAVLQVVELDGGGDGEADAAVPDALGRVHLAVAVLAAGGPGDAADPRGRVLLRPRRGGGRRHGHRHRASLGLRLGARARALGPAPLAPGAAHGLHLHRRGGRGPLPRPPGRRASHCRCRSRRRLPTRTGVIPRPRARRRR
jgi:hypothetical protein